MLVLLLDTLIVYLLCTTCSSTCLTSNLHILLIEYINMVHHKPHAFLILGYNNIIRYVC